MGLHSFKDGVIGASPVTGQAGNGPGEIVRDPFEGCEDGPKSENWPVLVDRAREAFELRNAVPLSANDLRRELGIVQGRQEIVDLLVDHLLEEGIIQAVEEGLLTSVRYELV